MLGWWGEGAGLGGVRVLKERKLDCYVRCEGAM